MTTQAERKIIEEARAIIRQGLLSPEEGQVLRRAAVLLMANGGAVGIDDQQIVHYCRGAFGLRFLDPPPPPPAPTPFDKRIAEHDMRVAVKDEGHNRANEQLGVRLRRLGEITGAGKVNLRNGRLIAETGVVVPLGDVRVPLKQPPDPDEVRAATQAAEAAAEECERARADLERAIADRATLLTARARWRADVGAR